MTTTHPKFVRWAVMLGLIVALNLFFVTARSLVFPQPVYDDFCPTHIQPALTEEACTAQDGVWIKESVHFIPDGETKPQGGYCDLYQKCQPLYDEANKEYQMYSFVIMVGLGVLALIVGVIPMGSSIVSSGLSYGGVLALIIASGGYWNEAGNLLKLGISLVALAALLYVGIKRFRD